MLSTISPLSRPQVLETASLFVNPDKIFNSSIIRSFNIIWEKTSRDLSTITMITKTQTAHTFLITWVSTVTIFFINLHLTFWQNYQTSIYESIFLNFSSSIILTPSFFAFSYLEPGLLPTTT